VARFWLYLAEDFKAVKDVHHKLPLFIRSRDLDEVFRGGTFDLLVVCFMPLVRPALTNFDCMSIGESFTIMRESPSVVCWDYPHAVGIFVAAIILFFMGLGLPLGAGIFMLTRKKRDLLNYANKKDPYGVFYHQFSEKFYWYCSVDILERAVFIVLSVAFADNLV